MIAYCWASGQIAFDTTSYPPDGTIVICRGTARHVQREIHATARLAYDNKTLLVPGVPEAANEDAAADALHLYLLWLKTRERKGFKVKVKPRNPFETEIGGQKCLVASADDRVRRVATFDKAQCMSALLVHGLQKTVRVAVTRRLRRLTSGAL